MSDLIDVIQATEERLVNLWPAVSTLLMDGWVVRFAHGYSGRANSASAIVAGAGMPLPLIETIERLYREAGLVPQVRITPLATADVEPMLLRRGYDIKDESMVMTAQLLGFEGKAADPRIRIEHAASRPWAAEVSALQEPSKRNADHLLAIVGQIRLPAAFATAHDADGRAVGFGMMAVDRGYAELGSIILAPGHRGQGLGRALVEALLIAAARNGGETAYLQVVRDNAVARQLYRRLGFTDLCAYRTLTLGP